MDVHRFFVDLSLGGLSSAAVSTFWLTPIDRIKLAITFSHLDPRIKSGELPPYKSFVDCGFRLMKEGRLWEGNVAACLIRMPTPAFSLAFNDCFKNTFPKCNPTVEFAKFLGANLACGSLAAACALIATHTLARENLKGLCKDFGLSVATQISYRGLQLGCFSTLTGLNPSKNDKGLRGAASTFTAALLANLVGCAVASPINAVDRRLRMQSEWPMERHWVKSSLDCLERMVAEEGVASLFRGFTGYGRGGALLLLFYDRAQTSLGPRAVRPF